MVWLLPLLSAVYAVWAGRDANWDLLNYHYYNVFAWLNGRNDLALGQLQSWFNPLLHLPLYLGMQYLDPRLYAALLGATQGLNLILIWSIANIAWPAGTTLRRDGPVLLALTAGCGAAFLTQLGTSFGDTLLTLPLLGALRLILSLPAGETTRRSNLFLFLAGLLAGIACGLKPLAGIYAIALAAALASLPGTLGARSRRLSILAAGGFIGVASTAGWWCWHVWQLTGNPLFPYYNDIFQSPWYWNERFVFGFFLPKTWREAILYPWLWLVNPARVSEISFINLAIPGLMTLLAVIGIARFLGLRPQGQSTNDTATRTLFVFWLTGYLLWLTQSSVYRFAAILEMLAPLLVITLLARWVPPDLLRTRILLVLIPLMLLNRPANFGRYEYAGRTMQLTPIHVPSGTMIALAGWAPTSYMVPAFPEGTPFVRIQSNMHGFAERPNGLDTEAHRRVKAHHGPVQLLLAGPEWHIAQPMLDHFGYVVDRAACRPVDGILGGGGGIEKLELCPMGVR